MAQTGQPRSQRRQGGIWCSATASGRCRPVELAMLTPPSCKHRPGGEMIFRANETVPFDVQSPTRWTTYEHNRIRLDNILVLPLGVLSTPSWHSSSRARPCEEADQRHRRRVLEANPKAQGRSLLARFLCDRQFMCPAGTPMHGKSKSFAVASNSYCGRGRSSQPRRFRNQRMTVNIRSLGNHALSHPSLGCDSPWAAW